MSRTGFGPLLVLFIIQYSDKMETLEGRRPNHQKSKEVDYQYADNSRDPHKIKNNYFRMLHWLLKSILVGEYTQQLREWSQEEK